MTSQFAMRFAQMCVALLVGCAAPTPRPTIDPALSPEQIVRALSNRKLTARGTSSDQFGLESFKQFLLPLDRRCQADGGQLSPLSPKEVSFSFRDANSNLREARVNAAAPRLSQQRQHALGCSDPVQRDEILPERLGRSGLLLRDDPAGLRAGRHD